MNHPPPAPDPKETFEGLADALVDMARDEGQLRLDDMHDGEYQTLSGDRAGMLRLAAILVRTASKPGASLDVEVPLEADYPLASITCTGDAEPVGPPEETARGAWLPIVAGLLFLALVGVFLVGLATVIGWIIR